MPSANTPITNLQSQKEFPMNLKTWTHILGPQKLSWRWTFVNFIKLPGYQYESTKVFRHRDFVGRVKEGPMEDRYLHHDDGKLRKLIVACSDELFEGADNTTWRRTYVRMVSPLRVRIATWVIDSSYDPKSWNDWWIMLLRAFPAAFATSLFVSRKLHSRPNQRLSSCTSITDCC